MGWIDLGRTRAGDDGGDEGGECAVLEMAPVRELVIRVVRSLLDQWRELMARGRKGGRGAWAERNTKQRISRNLFEPCFDLQLLAEVHEGIVWV